MTMTGPVDFFVDSDELDRLRSELETLSQELVWIESHLAYTEEAMGGSEVDEAIQAFRSGWRSVRLNLSKNLSEAAELVRMTIVQYENTEKLLHAAVADRQE